MEPVGLLLAFAEFEDCIGAPLRVEFSVSAFSTSPNAWIGSNTSSATSALAGPLSFRGGCFLSWIEFATGSPPAFPGVGPSPGGSLRSEVEAKLRRPATERTCLRRETDWRREAMGRRARECDRPAQRLKTRCSSATAGVSIPTWSLITRHNQPGCLSSRLLLGRFQTLVLPFRSTLVPSPAYVSAFLVPTRPLHNRLARRDLVFFFSSVRGAAAVAGRASKRSLGIFSHDQTTREQEARAVKAKADIQSQTQLLPSNIQTPTPVFITMYGLSRGLRTAAPAARMFQQPLRQQVPSMTVSIIIVTSGAWPPAVL